MIVLTLLLTVFLIQCEAACEKGKRFELQFEWTYVNFTWNNASQYQEAVASGKYQPVNVQLDGLKIYKDRYYFATAKDRDGVPVALCEMLVTKDTPRTNPVLTPFPSWEMNDVSNCDALINLQSMEIDKDGIMWVIDGNRERNISAGCPPKIVLFDLNDRNKIVRSLVLTNDVCLTHGGYLDDIVIDGDFAYITDTSQIDPGLVVYNRRENTAWKLRAASMFVELNQSAVMVDNVLYKGISPVNGIALSPLDEHGERTLYYSVLTGINLWSISTVILRNYSATTWGWWRRNITYVGSKESPGGGMMCDNEGTLYYSMIALYCVDAWNTSLPFSTRKRLDTNKELFNWADGFAFDRGGYLYNLAHAAQLYVDLSFDVATFKGPRFRVLRIRTCTKSYLED